MRRKEKKVQRAGLRRRFIGDRGSYGSREGSSLEVTSRTGLEWLRRRWTGAKGLFLVEVSDSEVN